MKRNALTISGTPNAFKWRKRAHSLNGRRNASGKLNKIIKYIIIKLLRRAIQKALVEENKRLAKEQATRLNHIDQEVYQNRPSNDYFSQFNTTSR